MTIVRCILPLAAGVALAASPAFAQDYLDRGVFVIVVNGAEAGREEFAIRPSTTRSGQGLFAVATTRLGGREVQQALELTADYAPVSFQLTETTAGRVTGRTSAQLAGVRFSARITSQAGESAREFPVRAPVAILADDAFSTYYFVPRPTTGSSRSLSVVRASDPRAAAATVEVTGTDTLAIADQQVAARRYVLRIADGDERQFWITAGGDLLQVAVPARHLVATRAELPRH